MIRVFPGASNPSHDFLLSDGIQTWGLRLDGGPDALREEPLTPSTLGFSGGVSSFGSWEPGLAQIEQRDWSGGRGALSFSADDAESARRFYDSLNAWTLTSGLLLPAPQWKLATGLRNAVQHLPGSMHWLGCFGAQRYIAARFTIGSADLAPARVRVWLRSVGSPGALNLAIYEDEDGFPVAALPDAGGVLTIANVPDVISRFHGFDVSAYAGTLSAGIDYHVVLAASATDNAANHWEIGAARRTQGGHISDDGLDWQEIKDLPYCRIEDAGLSRGFLFFEHSGAFYTVDQRDDGSPSHLYINGDRGLATSSTAASIEDAHKSWAADLWAGAWVRIVKGAGAGQARQVLASSAMELAVDPAWDQLPDATSQYVLYATDRWRDISPATGDIIDGVVSSVAVVDDAVLLAQGASVPILRMRFNPALATPGHEFDDDGTNVADLLHVFHHAADGPQIYRALAGPSEVSRAAPTAWGTPLTFASAIKVGDRSAPILRIFVHGGQISALKSQGIWTIDQSDQAHTGILDLANPSGLSANLPLTPFAGSLVLGWGKHLLQISASSMSDIGPARDLPADRQGVISALQPLSPGRLAAALDAAEGESFVLVFQDAGWHELMRAPESGQRIRSLGLQPCPGTRSRLWINVDGDLAYMDLPLNAETPLSDAGLAYQHEAAVISGTVDMGAALLPKYLKQFTLWSANLGRGLQVSLDYQADEEIGSPRWRSAGALYSTPLDSLPLQIGPLHAIRTRLRLQTSRDTQPPVVLASILEGFARTPLKYQWTLRLRLADLQSDRAGSLDANPDAFMAWLQDAARQARRIQMRSIWLALDDKYVIVEPPTLQREYGNSGHWGGTATVVLREG